MSLLGSTVGALRDLGYAVVVFSPEELDGCKPVDLEESLVSYAWEAIDALEKAELQRQKEVTDA